MTKEEDQIAQLQYHVDTMGQELYHVASLFSSLGNTATGLGTQEDKGQHTFVQTGCFTLTQEQLRGLYWHSGLLQRVINQYPEDSRLTDYNLIFKKSGLAYDNLESEEVKQELRLWLKHGPGTWDVYGAFEEASRLARWYGDSLIVMGIEDGKDPEEPVDENNIKSINWLKVIHPEEFQPDIWTAASDYLRPAHYLTYFEEVTKWHYTRVLRFKGVPLDIKSIEITGGYNLSVFQGMLNSLMGYYPGLQASSVMVQDHRIRLHGINDLGTKLEGKRGEEYKRTLAKRLMADEQMLSVLRRQVYDLEEEKIENLHNQYNGVDNIIKILREAWIADTDMTEIKLLNKSAATGSASGRAYDRADIDHAKRLNSWQRTHQEENLKVLFEYVLKALNHQDVMVNIQFPLFYLPTDMEILELQNLAATRDEKNIKMNVYSSLEARQSWTQAKFTPELIVPEEPPEDFEAFHAKASAIPEMDNSSVQNQTKPTDESSPPGQAKQDAVQYNQDFIEKRDGMFYVLSRKREVLGRHKTLKDAQDQLKAIEANKHKK